jgi:hypothetical protein
MLVDGTSTALARTALPILRVREGGCAPRPTLRAGMPSAARSPSGVPRAHLDGRSTSASPPCERRRELLLELELDGGVRWRTPRHFVGESEPVLAATREHGLEGVVATRLGSPYPPGAAPGSSTSTGAPSLSWSPAGRPPSPGGPRACCSHAWDQTESSSQPGARRSPSPTARPMRWAPARAPRPGPDSARPAHPPPRAGIAGRRCLPRPIPRARARPDPARGRCTRPAHRS